MNFSGSSGLSFNKWSLKKKESREARIETPYNMLNPPSEDLSMLCQQSVNNFQIFMQHINSLFP
jgi:hypothetical protein